MCYYARLVPIVLACLASTSRAEILPSFQLSAAAWRATHVVVVDAKGTVMESWKGDLAVGARIPVKEFSVPDSATVYYGYTESDPTEKLVTPRDAVGRVTDVRRAFFLIRKGIGATAEASSWQPAELIGRDMSVSVAWIESGQTFAIQQWINPGPALMHPLHLSETSLQAEVVRLVELQDDLRRAIQESDPLARAERLVSFLSPGDGRAHQEAIKALTECGRPAWRVVRRLLAQKEHLPIHHRLIHVAGDLVGADAIGELEPIVREESQYWSGLVKAGVTPVEYNPPMSDHYYKLSSSLFVLKRLGYRDPAGIVAKLRTEWDAVPRLAHLGSGDGKGRSPILQYADAILKPN